VLPSKIYLLIHFQEDYFCLEDESFLNDVIIDFYFKWIQHTIIPNESREKTHIFTTYFYKRLTTRPPKMKNKLHPIEDNVNLSPAEKRYERVRRWTKKVNIFDKDFVIVPINEHSHWFVAVICYPGLVLKEEKLLDKIAVKKVKIKPAKVMQIGSTSIIPLNKTGSVGSKFCLDDHDDERDEADASDDDMVVEESNIVLIKSRPVEKNTLSEVAAATAEKDPLGVCETDPDPDSSSTKETDANNDVKNEVKTEVKDKVKSDQPDQSDTEVKMETNETDAKPDQSSEAKMEIETKSEDPEAVEKVIKNDETTEEVKTETVMKENAEEKPTEEKLKESEESEKSNKSEKSEKSDQDLKEGFNIKDAISDKQ
jgi:hypothetical protein